ncbi:hypothetical protein [Kitasatospora cineracea]|uniref:hypothetical protein n=1 Tax=Kitasatospora cineracea TaxID=88074 RepID=UPI003787B363
MRTATGAPRRVLSAGVAVAAVGAGAFAFAAGARAEVQPVTFQLRDLVIQPGESERPLAPGGGVYGIADGTWVFAVSAKPLTDAGAVLELPAGLSVKVGAGSGSSACAAVAGAAGVYSCDSTPPNVYSSPLIGASDAAKDGTVAYYGAVFVPRGGSVADAVAGVKTSGSRPADGPASVQAARITVETPDHVARNTLRLTTPDLPAGGTVTQQVQVHAVDPGKLQLFFESAAGQPSWPSFPTSVGVKVADATAAPAGSCRHVTSELNSPTTIIWCDLPAGDSTVSYTLAAQPELVSWKVDVRAEYQVLTWGAGNPEAHGTFAFLGTTPAPTASPTATPTDPGTTPDPTATPTPTVPEPPDPTTAAATVTVTATPAPAGSPSATTAAPAALRPGGGDDGTLASTGADDLTPTLGGGLALVSGGLLTLVALHRRRGTHRRRRAHH